MISVIMPNQSWVVRYNQLVNRMPGIYATKLLEEIDFEPGETEHLQDHDEDNDLNNFIVGDDEYWQYYYYYHLDILCLNNNE